MRFKQKIAALLSVTVLLLGFAGCSEKTTSVTAFSIKGSERHIGSGATSFHTLSSLPETSVSASGFTAMSFEPSSAAVCVTELTKGNVWSVLPLFENGAASALDVVLRTSNGVYYLNSQDNSIAYGSYRYDITEKGGGFQRCRFVGRSNNNANANGGLVYANANNGSANSNTNIGSRLANNKNKNFNKIAPTENHHGMVNICERETQPSVKAAQCRKTETYHW